MNRNNSILLLGILLIFSSLLYILNIGYKEGYFSEVPVILFFFIPGLLSLAASYKFYQSESSHRKGYYSFLLGVIFLSLSSLDIQSVIQGDAKLLTRISLWILIDACLLYYGFKIKKTDFLHWGMVFWIFIFFYWTSFAWDINNRDWFGISYIPFFNPGGLVWITLAVSGFLTNSRYNAISEVKPKTFMESAELLVYFNRENLPKTFTESMNFHFVSVFISILSHIALLGLLTIQIGNFWAIYEITSFSLGLTYSIIWGIYAIALFSYGILTKKDLFIWFGNTILVVILSKVIFYDTAGQESIYKALSILISGITIVVIGWIYNRYASGK